MINLSFDTSEIFTAIDRLERISFDSFLRDTGRHIENSVTRRLSRGEDVENTPFISLRSSYSAKKVKAGYGNKAVLTATGELGRSLITDILANESFTTVIGMHKPIPGLTKEASAMQAIAGKLETGEDPLAGPREFLGIDETDIDWILNRFGKEFEPDLR